MTLNGRSSISAIHGLAFLNAIRPGLSRYSLPKRTPVSSVSSTSAASSSSAHFEQLAQVVLARIRTAASEARNASQFFASRL